MRVICFGDSITEGRSVSSPPDPAEYVHQPSVKWPAILQRKLTDALKTPIQVLNRGIGGNTTNDALQRLHKDVLPDLPAVVVMEFGINDALQLPGWKAPRVKAKTFGENIYAMIGEIREASQLPICLLLNHPTTYRNPQQNGRSLERNLVPYREAILEQPIRKGVHRLDLTNVWRNEPGESGYLSWDGLHLTEAGNHHYADILTVFLRRILLKMAITNKTSR